MKAADLFTLPDYLAEFAPYFAAEAAPWEWVNAIKDALAAVDWDALPRRSDIPAGVAIFGERVFIHPSVKLPPYASIQGPCWIGEGTEMRPGVYIRGNVIIGKNCVLGNSCEFKNCLLLDAVQAPHFNYVGDSVLGNRSHTGAGVILANLRLDKANVRVALPDGSRIDTGMQKLGSLFGDDAEAGCNAILQPGTILGRRAAVASGAAFGGYLEPNTIAAPSAQVRRLPRR